MSYTYTYSTRKIVQNTELRELGHICCSRRGILIWILVLKGGETNATDCQTSVEMPQVGHYKKVNLVSSGIYRDGISP